MQIERIEGVRCQVAEGPVWDAETGSLWLIDIVGARIIRVSRDGSHQSWATPEQVGAVAPTAGGDIAVGLASGFCVFDPESGRFGAVTPHGGPAGAVICEGKVDREGRFVAMSADSGFREPIGEILRWEDDGSVTRLDGDITLGNGPCWSVDGRRFFAADSMRSVIYAYEYDTAAGRALDARREFVSLTGRQGFPDGAIVDAEDHVWVVMHGSPCILRIDPAGNVVRELEMPTPNISSLTVGGDDMDTLFVTSLDPNAVPVEVDESARRAEGGVVYRVSDSGVRGIPDQAARVPAHVIPTLRACQAQQPAV